MIAGLREVLARRGLRGTLQRARQRLLPGTSWHDDLVYYELDLTDPRRPRRELPPDLTFRRGTEADAGLLAQLPSDDNVTAMVPGVVHERLRRGALLWVVTDGERLAFSCWNFLGAGPLVGPRAGEHPLPDGVVMLEDSIASPHVRGRGVAPSAWTAVADHHAAAGRRTIVTKVALDNVAVRRALEKVGFAAVAHVRRSGPVWRLRVEVRSADGGRPDHWLTSLGRGASRRRTRAASRAP